jgi:hypothetical protein
VMLILDGLPPGTTVEIASVLRKPVSSTEVPGGSLGGTTAQSTDMSMDMPMTGTGSLAGYARFVSVPLSLVEVHTAPRTPGHPVQSFDTDMFRLQGQIIGDPDFDLLRITGGSGFGLPSPGHTTLTSVGGGQWAVDSFFDITYRIDFIGHPGGPFSGRSGSTTGTIRMSVPEPASCALLALAVPILLRRCRS